MMKSGETVFFGFISGLGCSAKTATGEVNAVNLLLTKAIKTAIW